MLVHDGIIYYYNMKKIALPMIICLTFFLAIEIYSRIKSYSKDYDTKFLFYGGTNLEFRLKKIAFDWKRHNSNKDTVFTIAAFGGSTTAGHLVDPGSTYQALLEKNLRLSYNVKVINCGGGGMKLKGICEVFLKRLVYIKDIPDVAIIHTGLNDAGGRRLIDGKIVFFDEEYVNPNFFLRLDKTLEEYSLAYLKAKEKYRKFISNRIRSGNLQALANKPVGFIRTTTLDTDTMLKNFELCLHKILKRGKDCGIELILSTEPISDKRREDKEFMYCYNRVLDVIRNTAKTHNIVFLDFEKSFVDMPNHESLFMDEIHLNIRGNEILADEYARLIRVYFNKKRN